jgi:hypothetical protein
MVVKLQNRQHHWIALVELIEMDMWMTPIGLRMRVMADGR